MESDLQSAQVLLFAGIGILFMILLSLVVVILANKAQKEMLRQRMETQTLQLKHQQELLERNLLVQEEERQRIAAQLHDDIGSKLGVLNLTFHRLRRTEVESEQSAILFDEISTLITNTLQSTRHISHELLPPTLEDFGLVEALKEFSEGIRRTDAVEITFDHTIIRSDIPDATTELNLFRIVQELTNNSLKYAQATKITINLTKTPENSIVLQYTDNGQGFDKDLVQIKGLGLKNIENRVRIIGGTWQMETHPGAGFEATIKIHF